MCDVCVAYAAAIDANQLVPEVNVTTGFENLTRTIPLSTVVLTTNNALRLSFFRARKTYMASAVSTISSGTVIAITPSLVKNGIYAIDPITGDGTLVAVTANNPALYGAPALVYTEPLLTPYQFVRGKLYALAVLVVGAATAPQLCGQILFSQGSASEPAVASRLSGQITGMSDIPATFLAGSIVASSQYHYARLT